MIPTPEDVNPPFIRMGRISWLPLMHRVQNAGKIKSSNTVSAFGSHKPEFIRLGRSEDEMTDSDQDEVGRK